MWDYLRNYLEKTIIRTSIILKQRTMNLERFTESQIQICLIIINQEERRNNIYYGRQLKIFKLQIENSKHIKIKVMKGT